MSLSFKCTSDERASDQKRAGFTRDDLESLLERKFTKADIEEAHLRCGKGVDVLSKAAGDFSFHPLSKLLNEVGLPDLIQSLVKDLYHDVLARGTQPQASPTLLIRHNYWLL